MNNWSIPIFSFRSIEAHFTIANIGTLVLVIHPETNTFIYEQ